MANIFSGTLTRNWEYISSTGDIHYIQLLHDTYTGSSCVVIDNDDSIGKNNMNWTPPLFSSRVSFNIKGNRGFININRSGLIGYSYECWIGGQYLIEATQLIKSPETQNTKEYSISIKSFIYTGDSVGSKNLVWYTINCTRLSDSTTTQLHRRFKDFSNLHTQIESNLNGHHLRSSLPDLPDKHIKILHDHRNEDFIQNRVVHLNNYMNTLLAVPHVQSMLPLKIFLGINDNVL